MIADIARLTINLSFHSVKNLRADVWKIFTHLNTKTQDRQICVACVLTRWQHFLHEMTSWPPSWNYDVTSEIRPCQSMRIYLNNTPAEFHPDPIWSSAAFIWQWKDFSICRNNGVKVIKVVNSQSTSLLTLTSLAFSSSSMTCCTWPSCDVTLSNCQHDNNNNNSNNVYLLTHVLCANLTIGKPTFSHSTFSGSPFQGRP